MKTALLPEIDFRDVNDFYNFPVKINVASQVKSISPLIDTIPKNYLLIKLKYYDRTKVQKNW